MVWRFLSAPFISFDLLIGIFLLFLNLGLLLSTRTERALPQLFLLLLHPVCARRQRLSPSYTLRLLASAWEGRGSVFPRACFLGPLRPS